MIKKFSDILQEFIKEESKKLKQYKITHGPTIGRMYEGLTSDVVGRTLPESLGLRVVSGMIHDGGDKISGEIDCMLVKGTGDEIPYTDSYQWHVKDVLIIFEVKKNLYADNLEDSFEHLKGAARIHESYMENAPVDSTLKNVEPARRAFKEITGQFPPLSDNSELEPFEYIYHTLVTEQTSPLRIVIGFNSYKSEFGMRRALVDYIGKNMGVRGFGIGSFPQLIVCGDFSFVKLNGQPYSSIMQDAYWPFYASSKANPILLLIELIWTKLTNEFGISLPWGEDLQDENLALMLSGKIGNKDKLIGWEYRFHEINNAVLSKRESTRDWEPVIVDKFQFVVFSWLCKAGEISLKDTEFLSFLNENSLDIAAFVDSLQKTGMVALNNELITLSTYECRCAILPDGRYAVAEDNSGRFTRWVDQLLKSQES